MTAPATVAEPTYGARPHDGATRFTSRDADIVQRDLFQRPAADQHVTVMSILGDDGPRLGGMAAERLLQSRQRQVGGIAAAGIHLLQCHDVGLMAAREIDDQFEIVAAICPDPLMDVPGEDPDRTRQRLRPPGSTLQPRRHLE